GVAVLAAHLAGARVGATKHDRAIELPARHLPELGRVVEDLVEGDRAEVPRHKLDDRAQADHGRTDAYPGEAAFRDGRIDDALDAELVQHALADLVGALVVADFFSHQE